MKKTVAAAVAAAFVMGASATTFAAANPFSDVPAGHWAYKAVANLATEGIIEGYGDGTYRGDRLITRYEMAQMIAKALAKTDAGFAEGSGILKGGSNSGVENTGSAAGGSYGRSGKLSRHAVKADLDRLAAEFRDELDALGVRVAELEKYADKVVWNGELRYRYWNEKEDTKGHGDIKTTKNRVELRLLPTAEVNDHWQLKARIDARVNMSEDKGDSWDGDLHLRTAYAKGNYGKLTLQVGKFDFYTNVDDGLVMDDFLSGAAAIYGSKFKVALMAGRYSSDGSFDDPASYQGGELIYDNDKFMFGAGYHHFNSDDFKGLYGKDDANVWTVGTHYNFGGGFNVHGAYANNNKAKKEKKSWTAGLSYKGANKKEPGSWGISADYRYTSKYVSLAPTYDTWFNNTHRKGVEFGVDWTPIYNTYVKLGYFTGKAIDSKEDLKTFFGRVSWFF